MMRRLRMIYHTVLTVSLIFMMVVAGVPVYALSEEDEQSLINNWPQWDTYNPYSLACDPTSATDSALIGSDNVEKAFNFFRGKGLSAVQVSAMIGNFLQESGMNPASQQNNSSDSTHPIDGTGFGIAQWTFASRQAPLVKLADSKGVLPNTLAVQLDYVWQELNGSHNHALTALRGAANVDEATRAFHTTYEGSADGAAGIQERVDDAKRVLAKYGPLVNGVTPDSTSTLGCGSSNILVGEYAFPLAPQTKRNYGYTLPCTKPVMNGAYTRNGVYTDRHGKSTEIRACHHDATPAFDLSYGGVGNAPIYAITTGEITRVNPNYDTGGSGRPCNSITFKANIAADKSYYWYGHIIATRGAGPVNAGDVIGYVAPQEYGPRCWSGGVHLHIDRGCVIGTGADYLATGSPQGPGNDSCRDPGFLNDLVKIWEALPAP